MGSHELHNPPIDLAAMLDTVRRALAPLLGAELTLELGWPSLSSQLRPAGVHVTVALGLPGPGERTAELRLDAALAVNLVDRALGGRGQLGTATAASLPSDAECGVLAYLAARAVRSFQGVWVRDTCANLATTETGQPQWPVSVRWTTGAGVAHLAFPVSDDAALASELGWLERLRAEDREALAEGDVLTLDGAALSVTTQGLSGACLLRVAGLSERLRVLRDGDRLHGQSLHAHSQHADEIFVAWSDARFAPLGLARLAAGESLSLPRAASAAIRLFHGERLCARGELVRLPDGLGVRVTSVES